jgi:hypothetical protein
VSSVGPLGRATFKLSSVEEDASRWSRNPSNSCCRSGLLSASRLKSNPWSSSKDPSWTSEPPPPAPPPAAAWKTSPVTVLAVTAPRKILLNQLGQPQRSSFYRAYVCKGDAFESLTNLSGTLGSGARADHPLKSARSPFKTLGSIA